MTGAAIATGPRLGHPRYDVRDCTRGVLLPGRPLAVQAGLRSAWRSRAFLTARPGAVRMSVEPAKLRAALRIRPDLVVRDAPVVETTSWPLPRFRSAQREATINAGLLALAVTLLVVAWHLLAVR